ncbi:MAG: hypothetical protein A4E42_00774 [Methanoregulaceae archaeon PtaU1.Bin222]|nr:MAG: hypothetical protein A4E42_00774 [Methanoregulaceae archaeon PtaU1.Bin222]
MSAPGMLELIFITRCKTISSSGVVLRGMRFGSGRKKYLQGVWIFLKFRCS